MSADDMVLYLGLLGAAWLIGFKAGLMWKKFRDGLSSAAKLDS